MSTNHISQLRDKQLERGRRYYSRPMFRRMTSTIISEEID